MKVLIAGGGIGGLTAALCFKHFGWDVEVQEKSSELGDIGAGIQISPNAMRVFEALGMTQALVEIGFRPEAIELRMGESGRRLIRMPLGDTAQQRWGAPYLHIHRADLISVLQETLNAHAPGSLRLGCEVTGYDQCVESTSVTLASGEHRPAHVVVGADGIHSIIREQMLGPDKPVFTGNVAWRSVVPVERLGKDAPNPVAGAWMGRRKHAVTYLLRGGELANLVAVIEKKGWTEEGWSVPGDRKSALQDFQGWHPTITRIIKESDELFCWALFDRAPLRSWSDGRVVLMGDAAHPMLPFMAQGAAMAIEDAWALAALLTRSDDVQSGLQKYYKMRYSRATRIQTDSRANAKTFHQHTRLGQLKTYGPMWLAGQVAPKIGLARQDEVYGYDIVTETG